MGKIEPQHESVSQWLEVGVRRGKTLVNFLEELERSGVDTLQNYFEIDQLQLNHAIEKSVIKQLS